MHPAIIIGTVRSFIVDVAMGQIPRSTERISSLLLLLLLLLLLSYIRFGWVCSSQGLKADNTRACFDVLLTCFSVFCSTKLCHFARFLFSVCFVTM